MSQGMLNNGQFTKAYTDQTYVHTASVLHQGTVVAFAMDAASKLYYSVLYFDDPTITGSLPDADYWSTQGPDRRAPIPLAFPTEVRREGVGSFGQLALQATSNPDGSINQPSTGQLTSSAPFQVLSDGTYIYVFRQSNQNGTSITNTSTGVTYKFARNALLVDRYTLSGGSLSLLPEVRFQRSRSKDFPANNKDSLSPTDMNGAPFVEPTHELAMVQGFKSFAVALVPTQVAGSWRWQIFAQSPGGWIDAWSVLQASDGLFDFAGPLSFACPNASHVYVQPHPGACSHPCGLPLQALVANNTTTYYCPTHLGYTSASPGYCPTVCGLTFAQVPSARTAEACLALGNQVMADLGRMTLPGSFTLELWCQRTQNAACTLLFQNASGGLEIDFDAAGTLSCGSLATYSQNNDLGWHHYALVYDGNAGSGSLYKDGVLYAAGAVTFSSSAASLYLGAKTTSAGATAPVNVDELRIWNVALSQAEIQTNLRGRAVGNEKALAHYFRFDEGSGTTVHDTVGSGVGTVWNVGSAPLWVPSSAPIGQAGGVRYQRVYVSPLGGNLAAQLYYQQEALPAASGGASKLQQTAARMMLAFDTAASGATSVGVLDFAVGADGQLAQAPDLITLPSLASSGQASLPLALLSMDGRGLTVYGGVLPFTATPRGPTAPAVYDSVTGELRLYYGFSFDHTSIQLTWAAFDTTVVRPTIQVQGSNPGYLVFAARTAAADFNDLSVSITQPSGSSALTVTISHGAYTETWTGVPSDAQTLAAILDAQPLPPDANGNPQSYDYTTLVTASRADADFSAGSLLVAAAAIPFAPSTTFTVTPTAGPFTCASAGGTSGKSAAWKPTPPGSAFVLSGTPLRLATLAESAAPPTPTWDLTLEAWVSPTQPALGPQYLVYQSSGGGRSGYHLQFGPSIEASIVKSGMRMAVDAPVQLPGGQWSHVAAVFHQKAAVRLDGNAGYLDCGNDSSLSLTGDLTIEAWVQLTANLSPASTIGLISKGLLGDGTGGTVTHVPYALYIDNGLMIFAYSRSDGTVSFAAGPGLPNDLQPHSIAVTRRCNQSWTDSSADYRTLYWDLITFYVDGAKVASVKAYTADYVNDDSSSSIADDEGNLLIGRVGAQGVPFSLASTTYATAGTQSANAPIYGSSAKNNLKPNGIGGLASAPASLTTPLKTLQGLLTEVRLWDSALPAGSICRPLATKPDGLVARWRFEERQGIQSADVAGSSTALFMNGVSWDQSQDVSPISSSWTVYVNGLPVASPNWSARSTQDPWPQLYLGGRGGPPESPSATGTLQASLAEVRIWNMERTATQVLENMHRPLERDPSTGAPLDNPASLLAYYTLDSAGPTTIIDRADPSGAGANLIAYTPFHLDGNTSFLAPSGIDLGGSFTVELWFKRDALGHKDFLLGQGATTQTQNQCLAIGFPGSDFMSFGFCDHDLRYPFTDLGWHHWAFVYDRSQGATGARTIYLDGQVVASDKPAGSYGGTGTIIVGRNTFDPACAAGSISELRIWTVARSQSAIAADMSRPLTGTEPSLAVLFPFDGNTSTMASGAAYPAPSIVPSTAPVGAEMPEAWSGFGAAKASGCVAMPGSPLGVAEYGVVETDAAGNTLGTLKRCYSLIQGSAWFLSNGFKIGPLLVEWVGQVQFNPTLLGYIEGAPPVPGENMIQPGVDYRGASSVQLNIADEVDYTYSAQRDKGFDYSIDSAVQAGFLSQADVGAVGFSQQMFEARLLVGAEYTASGGTSRQDGVSPTIGLSQAQLSEMDLDGYHYDAGDGLGARFVPRNVGYGLVKSGVADQYALRLATTGAVIGYRMVVNPKIPPDWNIITFQINPYYIRQGCLDGRFGVYDASKGTSSLVNDPHFPAAGGPGDASYFRVNEAYALKSKIVREEQRLATQYARYDAVGIGNKSWVDTHLVDAKLSSAAHMTMEDGLDSLVAAPDASSSDGSSGDQDPAQLVKRSMWNTYLWTAYGGLFAETEQTLDGYTETLGGSYSFSSMAGLNLQWLFAAGVMGPAMQLNLSALFGGHVNVSVSKSASATTDFGVSVSVDLDRTLCANPATGGLNLQNVPYDTVFVNGTLKQLQAPQPLGGLVDAYRFMTFYLAPESSNNTEFWSRVVNTQWLQTQDPNAVALRQVLAGQGAKTPPCWRVLHRVTFVSRIKPDKFQPVTPDSPVIALDAGSHYLLIEQLEPYVRGATRDFPTLLAAVKSALATCYGADFPALTQPDTETQVAELMAQYYGVPVPTP